jgi:hypothetical protein
MGQPFDEERYARAVGAAALLQAGPAVRRGPAVWGFYNHYDFCDRLS